MFLGRWRAKGPANDEEPVWAVSPQGHRRDEKRNKFGNVLRNNNNKWGSF